jgi:selenocysteine-specific elongation factor
VTARDAILGTAGHIDHGKTSLVRALTGVDTDRLAQEKQRGISIDIGFAHLELDGMRLGIVDVPGHERFVRNMLAGATGIDLALLVVAADDSVMPQTREHLEILRLLDVPDGVIALTKTDLVEPDWLDLVEDDIRRLVAPTFLAEAPIVRTSTATGAGIDTLRAELTALARRHRPRPERAAFRMSIDRSFVLQGLGTVVTGTVWQGTVRPGDELEWLPSGKPLRARRVQSHGLDVDAAHQGQRAALNVTGAHHAEIERGHVVATPGTLRPARCPGVALRVIPDSPWPLRHRARVRLHVGTQELTARVLLLEGTSVAPGDEACAQLLTESPAVVAANQPFVLRSLSPMRTIGGGRVLLPGTPRIRRRDRAAIERLQRLAGAGDRERAALATWFGGTRPGGPDDLARRIDVDPADAASLHADLRGDGTIVDLPAAGTALHRDVLADLDRRTVAALERLHAAEPMAAGIPVERVQRDVGGEPAVVAAVLERLRAAGTCTGTEQAVALAGVGPSLTEAQRALRERIRVAYRDAAFQPPTLRELATGESADERGVRQIVDLLVAEGELVHLAADLYLHGSWRDEAQRRLRSGLAASDGMTVSEIKATLDTSRKYAVPMCEYLDRSGFTRRRGDKRVLAAAPAE